MLSPSVLELQDRHPELAGRATTEPRPRDHYVELLQCSPQEVNEISGLLEPEGISCVIEPSAGFHYESQMDDPSRVDDPKSLVVKIRADQISKARALLDWEVEQNGGPDAVDDPIACPSCGAEVSPFEETCPECDGPLADDDSETDDMNVEVYRCSACGATAGPGDLTCSTCGARLDH